MPRIEVVFYMWWPISGEGRLVKGTGTSRDNRTTPKEILLGEVESKGVFRLLILGIVRKRPEYGNSIIRGIEEMTEG